MSGAEATRGRAGNSKFERSVGGDGRSDVLTRQRSSAQLCSAGALEHGPSSDLRAQRRHQQRSTPSLDAGARGTNKWRTHQQRPSLRSRKSGLRAILTRQSFPTTLLRWSQAPRPTAFLITPTGAIRTASNDFFSEPPAQQPAAKSLRSGRHLGSVASGTHLRENDGHPPC